MKRKIDQLEARLRSLIEIHLVNLFIDNKIIDNIAHQLTRAVQSNILILPDNSIIAPDIYRLIMHPELIERLQGDQIILDTIKQVLDTIRIEMGFLLATKPTISIATNASLAHDEIQITATHNHEAIGETQGMPLMLDCADSTIHNLPASAFLIMHGTKVFHLDQLVINIGRRKDNQLNINDPRISRKHAQMRAIKGRYILFDLNSTGGTYVNGEQISQIILKPGDVISLAEVSLIYGQDDATSQMKIGDTSPIITSTKRQPADSNQKMRPEIRHI